MKAEVISIGSELVTGQTLDTNSQWLSTRLAEMGIRVHFHTTVADDLDENVAVFRTAVQRADLVLITGGIGPTQDDLTRDAIAAMAGVPLELHAPSLEHIESLFARRGREMPTRNKVQAMFPKGSEAISNPEGTAPGIWMRIPRVDAPEEDCSIVVAMPGVPSEMKRMFQHEVAPRLRAANNNATVGNAPQVIIHRRIHCFGLGESTFEEKLMDLTRRGREPEVGITVHEATITLRITARGASAKQCAEAIEPTVNIIHQRLGSYVYGQEGEELQDAVATLLRERATTLACAESGTGGLIAQRLTSVPELGGHFRGSVVALSDQVRRDLLGVAPELLDAHGPAASETVAAMAAGCRTHLGADLGLAVGEVFVRDPEGDRAAPRVCVALASPQGTQVSEHNVGGDPSILCGRLAKIGLNRVRLHLLNHSARQPASAG